MTPRAMGAVVATAALLLPAPTAAASRWIEDEDTWIWLGPAIGVAVILCIAVVCFCKRSVRTLTIPDAAPHAVVHDCLDVVLYH